MWKFKGAEFIVQGGMAGHSTTSATSYLAWVCSAEPSQKKTITQELWDNLFVHHEDVSLFYLTYLRHLVVGLIKSRMADA